MIASCFSLLCRWPSARNRAAREEWIDLGFFSLQPGELVKIVLIYALSFTCASARSSESSFGRRLRSGAHGPVVAEKDLGAALIYAGVVIVAMYYAATGNLWITAAGVAPERRGGAVLFPVFTRSRARGGVEKPLVQLLRRRLPDRAGADGDRERRPLSDSGLTSERRR
jgi:cell division protein FtsW (lipid II flippase)